MRIVILAIGRLRPPFVDDVQHYLKLLSRYAAVEVVEVADGGALARRVPQDAFTSLLALDGKAYDSVAFSRFLEGRRFEGRALTFVIGGPFGLELESDHRLSLGPMTLPHQLARVVLLEQLYRAHRILAGEPYHY